MLMSNRLQPTKRFLTHPFLAILKINDYLCIIKMKDRGRNEKQHKPSSAVKLKKTRRQL